MPTEAMRRVRSFDEVGKPGAERNLVRQLQTFEKNAGDAVDRLTSDSLKRFEFTTGERVIAAPGQAIGVSPTAEDVALEKPSATTAGRLTAVHRTALGSSLAWLKADGATINGLDAYPYSSSGLALLVNDGKNYHALEFGRRFDVTFYGASPRASADVNDAAFQRAADAIRDAGGGTLWIPAGHFNKLTTTTIYENTTVEGEGDISLVDFPDASTTTIAFTVAGTQAAGVALSTDAAEGSDDLDVSGAGFADGDWVKVYSTAVTGSTNIPKGEICRVNDASAMTLFDPLCDSYATADMASVALMGLVEGVAFKSLRIRGPADNSVIFSGILADRTIGTRFENVTTERCHFYGIGIQDAVQWSAVGCKHSQSEAGGLAYGIALLNAAQDGSITGCTGYRLRHLVTHGGFSFRNGVPRRTVTSACVASQARNSGFDAHAGGEDISFVNCTVLGSESDGFTIECASATLTGCTVKGTQGPAFHLNPQSVKPFRLSMSGCSGNNIGFETVGSAIQIQVHTGFEQFDSISITGGAFANYRYGVRTINAETGRIANVSIAGVVFNRCGVDQDAVIAIVHATRVAVTGCTINDDSFSVDGVSLNDVTHFTVHGNAIQLTAAGSCRGVRCLTTCDDGTIGGNAIDTGASGIGIGLADTTTNVTIGNDNHLSGCPTPLSLGTGAGHKLAQVNEASADRGNVSVTLLHYSEQTQRFDTALTNNRTVTLPSANVKMRFRIVRGASATGAFNLEVGTGPLKTLTAAGLWCDVESDGTNYTVTGSGAL